MKRFSQRIGAVQASTVIQLESMSPPLRNSIWNFIVSLHQGGAAWQKIAEMSAQFFFKVPVDELYANNSWCKEWIKEKFFGMAWYEVYDFVEFIIELNDNKQKLRSVFNHIFEGEMSGYRFIGEELAPLSNPAEVQEIELALASTSRAGLEGAHTHITTALQLLAKRPDPDYRNSIKESISAVESLAKSIGAGKSQGLADALTELGKKVSIHGGLKAGLLSLYGYASDEGGIRHAMLEEPNVGFDEAKYMAVACSAFVNFLAAKAQDAGILTSYK